MAKIIHNKKHNLNSTTDHAGTLSDSQVVASNVTQHESAITHDNLSGAGTNTHAQIDTHIADVSNPHSVTAEQAGAATKQLDNLGVTAINADLLPSGDNLRDLGTSANKFKDIFSVDIVTEDLNGDDYRNSAITHNQLNVFNEMMTSRVTTTAATASGVRTITWSSADTPQIKITGIIDRKQISQPTQADMTATTTTLNGTDTAPKDIYYYFKNTAGDLVTASSNTNPDGVVGHIDGVEEVVGSITGSTSNVFASVNHEMFLHEKVEGVTEHALNYKGVNWISGMAITATASSLSIASGVSWHGIGYEATTTARTINLSSAVDDIYMIKSDGTFETTNMVPTQYADGTVIDGGGDQYIIAIIKQVNINPELNSSRLAMCLQNSDVIHDKAKDAWDNKKQQKTTVIPDSIVERAATDVCMVVLFWDDTAKTFALEPDSNNPTKYYRDLRQTGANGGSGSGGSTADHEITSGAGAPASTPTSIGDHYINTTNNDIYVAIGTASSADWKRVDRQGVDKGQVTVVFDGGGSVLTTGDKKMYLTVPYTGTITGVRLLADQSGDIVIDIWKDTYANYPPTVADTITASAKPTITTAVKSEDTTLTGWTTSVATGDILEFNIDSVTSITKCIMTLTIDKTGA